MNPQDSRSRRSGDNSKLIIIICVLLIAVLCGIVLYLLNNRPEPGSSSGVAEMKQSEQSPAPAKELLPPQAEEPPAPPQPTLTDIISQSVFENINESREEQPDNQNAAGTEESDELPLESVEPAAACKLIDKSLQDFIFHLESQTYMQPYLTGEPSGLYFERLFKKLLDNPPVVARETDDLFTVLKNTAHFFRVIGRDNIQLIKAILDHEQDAVEEIAASLYGWAELNSCESAVMQLRPVPERLYDYAGFFLNTIGGRSYLFRRNSRSRLLVNYYSILMLDHANERGLNLYGIDIRPMIPVLMENISSSNQLKQQRLYLETLSRLQDKY